MDSDPTRGTKRRIVESDKQVENLLTLLPDDVHRIISTFYQIVDHDPPLVQISKDNKIRIRVEQTKDGLVRYTVQSLPRALINQRVSGFQLPSPKASFGNKWVEFSDYHPNNLGTNITFSTSLYQVWTIHDNWFRECDDLRADIAKLNGSIVVRNSDQAIRFDTFSNWIKPLPLFPEGGTMILE